MKKGFKIFLIISISLITIGSIAFLILDKPLPKGKSGPEAELLAEKMLKAVNKEAWDTTFAVRWLYEDHDYIWDRTRYFVQVQWDNNKVLLHTPSLEGVAFKNEKELTGEDKKKALKKAWEYFANDSFWLIAPYKIKDPGTVRSIVNVDGEEALMVHYSSGGVTPGDTYLWLLNEEGLPYAWRFWVKIIPFGGLEFSWENWTTVETGAKFSLFHDGLVDVVVKNVIVGNTPKDINGDIDPFKDFSLN